MDNSQEMYSRLLRKKTLRNIRISTSILGFFLGLVLIVSTRLSGLNMGGVGHSIKRVTILFIYVNTPLYFVARILKI
mgnify:CR=1 FL=1